jgi:hypothetical protein
MNGQATTTQQGTAHSKLELTENALTQDEEQERLHLERKVERAFYEAGKSLAQLRDHRLYRNTHSSFEEYCRERFGFQRRHCYQLIDAAGVVDNLIQFLEQDENCAPVAHILPTKERQVRSLVSLEPSEQREAWVKAVNAAGGKLPNSRQVSDAAARIKERELSSQPNPHYVGEICRFQVKDNPELRGLVGFGGIVSQVNDFSCTVKTYKGEILVNNQHLESMNYTSLETEQVQKLYQRLWKLREVGALDGAAVNLLNYLEKQHSPSLTPVQEQLLHTLESYYLG